MLVWNPWHGCHKYSSGCQHCYMFRRDAEVGKDSEDIYKTMTFDLPLKKNRDGSWKMKSEKPIPTCMTSDFFLPEVAAWRSQAWNIIHERSDQMFMIPTKRITEMPKSLPDNWGDGYDNVIIMCTVENMDALADRASVFLSIPIKHRWFLVEPFLEKMTMDNYLESGGIEAVLSGGESGDDARVCDIEWVRDLRHQCFIRKIPFCFKQTGAHFRVDGKVYNIPREKQMSQAMKSGLSTKWLL